MNRAIAASLLVAVALLGGCGYGTLQSQDEQVKTDWSEVVRQYQRRGDLVPELVAALQRHGAQEERILLAATQARAKAGSVRVTQDVTDDAQALLEFARAQAELSAALAELRSAAERDPRVQADAGFRDLQARLEDTQNRVAVARNRYQQAVLEYNATVRSFPASLTALIFGFREKPQWAPGNEAGVVAPPTK